MAPRRSQAIIALALLPLLARLGQAGHGSVVSQAKVDPLSTQEQDGESGSKASRSGAAAQQQQQEQQRRLFVPLIKRARTGGPVYGVDVSEGGISHRKLKPDGVGITGAEEGEGSVAMQSSFRLPRGP